MNSWTERERKMGPSTTEGEIDRVLEIRRVIVEECAAMEVRR